jgi:hypothetical protein
MASSERWPTARRWGGVLVGVQCHGRGGPRGAVGARDGGRGAGLQGDYAEAALPLADAGSLAPRLMNVAAVSYAQGQYPAVARLYQRALVFQEEQKVSGANGTVLRENPGEIEGFGYEFLPPGW